MYKSSYEVGVFMNVFWLLSFTSGCMFFLKTSAFAGETLFFILSILKIFVNNILVLGTWTYFFILWSVPWSHTYMFFSLIWFLYIIFGNHKYNFYNISTPLSLYYNYSCDPYTTFLILTFPPNYCCFTHTYMHSHAYIYTHSYQVHWLLLVCTCV